MAMENGPFKDVLPMEHGDIPANYVSLPEGSSFFTNHPTKTDQITGLAGGFKHFLFSPLFGEDEPF